MQESQREVGIVLNEQKHVWEGLSKKSANTTLIISKPHYCVYKTHQN